MKLIERNRVITGRLSNMVFGLACVADGLVRFLSFGFLHTRIPLELSKWQTMRHFAKLKKEMNNV